MLTQNDVKKFNIDNISRLWRPLKDNPKTIQEKIIWLNIYDIPWSDEYNMPLKSLCTDKILMKEYVYNILGENIAPSTLFVYNNTNEIEWDKLPSKFVIKCNHDCGSVVICRDKSNFNKEKCILKLNKYMSIDPTFNIGFESHYHWINRKILIEELLEDAQHNILKDYKFICINGNPIYCQVLSDRFTPTFHCNYYDMDFNFVNISRIDIKNNPNLLDKKPNNFDLMIKYSKILSSTFKFVRVDFYEVNNKVYLGELTFTPAGGLFKYKNPEDDILVGDMLKLN